MIAYPLTAENRRTLAGAFREVPRVDIAIECVVAGTMGEVFVDDAEAPRVFQVAFPPFFYFAGDPGSGAGDALVRGQASDSLLMPSAPGWKEAFLAAHGPRLVAVERYSFDGAGLDEHVLSGLVSRSPWQPALHPLDHALAARLAAEEEGVVDLSAFASIDDFLENGCGYCLVEAGMVTGVAFTSLAHPQAVEVSIFVEPPYREAGRATILGAALLRAALAQGKRPNWDATNLESCRLAEKLGYRPSDAYVAHWLVI